MEMRVYEVLLGEANPVGTTVPWDRLEPYLRRFNAERSDRVKVEILQEALRDLNLSRSIPNYSARAGATQRELLEAQLVRLGVTQEDLPGVCLREGQGCIAY